MDIVIKVQLSQLSFCVVELVGEFSVGGWRSFILLQESAKLEKQFTLSIGSLGISPFAIGSWREGIIGFKGGSSTFFSSGSSSPPPLIEPNERAGIFTFIGATGLLSPFGVILSKDNFGSEPLGFLSVFSALLSMFWLCDACLRFCLSVS